MHDARTKRIPALRQRLSTAKQCVHQRAGGIAGACMYGHSGWLVDGHDVLVFVENIERNGFGFSAQRRARPDFDGDVLAASYAMRALGRASIDEHQSGRDEFLYARAADAIEAGSDALIEAFAGLIFGNDEFVVRRFVALAHPEIVAVVTMAYALRGCRSGTRRKGWSDLPLQHHCG